MKYQQDIPRSVISWFLSYLDLLQRTNKHTLQNHLFKRHQTNQNSPNRCTLFPCKSALQHEFQKNISTSFCQCGTTYRSWKTSTSACGRCFQFIERKDAWTFPYYFWWKNSCTSWYGEYPIIQRVLYIPSGARFLPSTGGLAKGRIETSFQSWPNLQNPPEKKSHPRKFTADFPPHRERMEHKFLPSFRGGSFFQIASSTGTGFLQHQQILQDFHVTISGLCQDTKDLRAANITALNSLSWMEPRYLGQKLAEPKKGSNKPRRRIN